MMQTAAKRLFDHVIQDELIKIITACFTVALEEEERKTIESYMPMMSKNKKNPGKQNLKASMNQTSQFGSP